MKKELQDLVKIYPDYIDNEGYVQRYNYDKSEYYNTGTCLKGPRGNPGNPGRPGKDGLTPRINQDNGHWMIGDVDTGVPAAGTAELQLKTINGESVEGEGNIVVKSYHTFNNNWTTNSTTLAFCQDIVNDSLAIEGMTYLGKLRCSDLPESLSQGEAVVEIIAQDANGKNIHIILNSSDTSPYRWEYHYCKINGNYTTLGWKGYQLEINNSNKLDYSLLKNTPSIPAAQIQSDWNLSNQLEKDFIKNKPTIVLIWRGTQVQYDALAPNYDNNTIYIITS